MLFCVTTRRPSSAQRRSLGNTLPGLSRWSGSKAHFTRICWSLITNLIVDTPSRGAIKVGASDRNQDGLNELAEKTIPDILAAAIEGTNQAYREANRPTADIHLPQLDEYTLGQFFQFMMLATAVEGRLIGINPYGQPGVEAYKKNMNAILRR